MSQEQRTGLLNDLLLARDAAIELRQLHPTFFQTVPVRIAELARVLGMVIEERTRQHQRAQLEIFDDGNARSSTIAILADLDPNVSRFAIAHEIGHAVLLTRHPKMSREWSVDRREAFANAFATEVLAPPEFRKKFGPAFRALDGPLELPPLASRLGLSVHALLTLASEERSWTRDLDRIWFRVKYVPNENTGRDRRLRVVSVHCDPSRYFIPKNQSFSRVIGDERWLASLPPGGVARHCTTIRVKFVQPTTPRFVWRDVAADLSAMRLRPSSADLAAYLIVLAKLSL